MSPEMTARHRIHVWGMACETHNVKFIVRLSLLVISRVAPSSKIVFFTGSRWKPFSFLTCIYTVSIPRDCFLFIPLSDIPNYSKELSKPTILCWRLLFIFLDCSFVCSWFVLFRFVDSSLASVSVQLPFRPLQKQSIIFHRAIQTLSEQSHHTILHTNTTTQSQFVIRTLHIIDQIRGLKSRKKHALSTALCIDMSDRQ